MARHEHRRATHVQIILEVLDDQAWHSLNEILGYAWSVHGVGINATHSRIAELRRRGYVIEHVKRDGDDGNAHGYQLLSSPSLPTPAGTADSSPPIPAGVGSEDAELALGAGGAVGGPNPQLPMASPAPPLDEALPPPALDSDEPEQLSLEAA